MILKNIQNGIIGISVLPPPFLQGVGAGGGLCLQPNFQKGAAWQDLNF